MDQINNYRDAKRLQSVTSASTAKISNISTAYRQTIGKLVVKVTHSFSVPSPEVEELAVTVETWCEVLSDTIPIERLQECYLYAMKHRTSTFPLVVVEVREAYRAIRAEEEAKKRPSCVLCYGYGSAMVYDPKTDSEFVKECPYCFGKISTSLQQTG